VTYGFVLESYIREGKSPQGSRQDKYFKGISFLIIDNKSVSYEFMTGLDLVPLIQEHERAMGFYGMVFGEKSLRLFAPEDALQFTTFWADSNGKYNVNLFYCSCNSLNFKGHRLKHRDQNQRRSTKSSLTKQSHAHPAK
jgi:hypothetical protein